MTHYITIYIPFKSKLKSYLYQIYKLTLCNVIALVVTCKLFCKHWHMPPKFHLYDKAAPTDLLNLQRKQLYKVEMKMM